MSNGPNAFRRARKSNLRKRAILRTSSRSSHSSPTLRKYLSSSAAGNPRFTHVYLDRIRAVTMGTLICETHALVPAFHEKYPLVSFFPGDGHEAGLKYEFSSEPTIEAMRQMLRSAGFTTVDIKHTPSMRWLKKIKAAITTRPESGRLIVHAS